MSFESDWAKIMETVDRKISQGVRATMFEVSTAIIKGTPVDTGRAKANWFVSINSPHTGTTDDTDDSKRGSMAPGKMHEVNVATGNAIGQTLYLTNNLPYIYRLEFDGWSDQARAGWIRQSLQEFNRLLVKNIRAA